MTSEKCSQRLDVEGGAYVCMYGQVEVADAGRSRYMMDKNLDGESMEGDIDGDAHGGVQEKGGGFGYRSRPVYMARSWLQKSPMYIIHCSCKR